MGDDKPTYYFTKLDDVTRGGQEDGIQGPYVTPYGLPRNTYPNATVDGKTPLDLDLSKSQEPWRAKRFHESFTYEWVKIPTPPDSVKTIADLCKFLREQDPIGYPPSIYGDKNIKMPDGQKSPSPTNTAQALFDHWRNSKFRCATFQSWSSYDKYSKTPGDIEIVCGSEKLEYAPRGILHLNPTPAAPGAQSKSADDDLAKVREYVQRLKDHTSNIETLKGTIERAMRDRWQVLNRLNALKAICTASMYNTDNPGLEAGEIAASIDKILPKVHDLLVQKPVRFGGSTQQLTELFKERREFTNDAAADLQANVKVLKHLLIENDEHTKNILAWAKANQAGLLEGRPTVKDDVDALTQAMADAHVALGDFAETSHADDVLALLDKMPNGHAVSPDDIKGASPTEVLLSLVGKGVSLGQTACGNLAGPPSLSVALVEVYATWKFGQIAKAGLGEVNGMPRWIGNVTELQTKLFALGDRLTKHLPEGELQDKIRGAVHMEDRKALTDLKEEYGKAMAGATQSSTGWKCSMAILGILGVIATIGTWDANADPATKDLNCLSFLTQVTSVSLGTAEAFLTCIGKFDAVSASFSLAGNCVGVVGGILGAFQGAVAYIDAANRADGVDMIASYAGVLGSVGMTAVAACAVAGVTIPGLGQVALALLLVSGGISLTKSMIQGDNLKSKTQLVCGALVKAIRGDCWGRYCETNDASVLFAMEDMDKTCNGDKSCIFDARNSFFIVRDLAKAGLPKELIQQVVNSEALANTPFGPGPGPSLPAR